MDTKRKFEDLYYEIYDMRYNKNSISIRQFNNLIENIKLYLERCVKEEHDDYYYIILDLYHDINELLKHKNKKGNIQKIKFNHFSDKIHNIFKIKNKEKV